MGAAEFRRRDEANEDLEHIELIEGVVYMPSPIKFAGHSEEQGLLIHLAGAYASLHSGTVRFGAAGTIWMDEHNAPEPDVILVRNRAGIVGDDGYLTGAPELVMEVANSSRSRDLHQKKAAYERNGVIEYIVWRTQDQAVDWFQLGDGRYERREPDASGIIESEVFPGLRLHVPACSRTTARHSSRP
jgi:Uma2 family endonuclease